MQPTRAKPSPFPYLVVLAVAVVNLAFLAAGVYNWQKLNATPGYDHDVRLGLFYSMLGSSLVTLAISVAFGFAFTQWLLERGLMAGPPGYAAFAIGLLKALIGVALAFSWSYFVKVVMSMYHDSARMMLVAFLSACTSHLIAIVAVMLPIGLIFRMLRSVEAPAAPYPAELQGRALLIFTLFAWSWILIVAEMLILAASGYDDTATEAPPLMLYAGSFGLVLSVFLGAKWGLPQTMLVTRPGRLWLAATLAVLVCAGVIVAVSFAMVWLGEVLGAHIEPGIGFSALVALVWFAVSIPLCGLLVKALTRSSAQAPSLIRAS